MKLGVKTIRTLIRLRNGESVNEGELSSRQLKEIIDILRNRGAVSLSRKGTLRGIYHAPDRKRFEEACELVDSSLKNLDAALTLASGEVFSRAEKVALFGNSKQDGADKTVKGFTILADRVLNISYQKREYVLNPSTGLHIINKSALAIPEHVTVIVVENAECFYDLRWIPNAGLRPEDGPYIIMCRFPICEEGKLWLEFIPNRILYFGDFDLAGIRIYETEFKRRLRDRISFIIPSDIEDRIRQSGNPSLYSKQVNEGFANLKSYSEELTNLISRIHLLQSTYEQEGYCFYEEQITS